MAEAKTFSGFTFNPSAEESVLSGTITGDGRLVLKVYYTRKSYKVTYKYTGDVPKGATEIPAERFYKYEAYVTVEEKATAPGYDFHGWNRENFNMPAVDVEITGSFTAKGDTPYTVKHYQQQLDGSYKLKADDTELLKGQTDTVATATAKSYTGFTHNPNAEGAKETGIITGDGKLELSLFYDRNSYTVTYQYTDKVPEGASTLPEEKEYLFGDTVNVAGEPKQR